ncbi:MAG TPA: hypothetical protein VJA21_06395 [Verrucomicrobiae bacterium]
MKRVEKHPSVATRKSVARFAGIDRQPLIALLSALALVSLSGFTARAAEPQHYDQDGFSFDYDPTLKVEVVKTNDIVTLNLTGCSNLVFTIQRATFPMRGDIYGKALVEGMQKGMKGAGAKVEKIRDVKLRIGDKERTGRGFTYLLGGVEFFYQAFCWDVSMGIVNRPVLVFLTQYPPASEAAVKPLMEPTLRSFRYTKP